MASITLGVPPQVIVDLWWNDNSNNEDGFIIERKTNNSNFQVIDSVMHELERNRIYEDWNVIDSTIYSYKIAAYNAINVSIKL